MLLAQKVSTQRAQKEELNIMEVAKECDAVRYSTQKYDNEVHKKQI